MGGKSGGGARTPRIDKNTLNGANRSKHVDLISSGEIFGFEHGNDSPLRSIYLNNTPIQNKDGSLNFGGVRVEFNRGTEDQDYLPSFTSLDRNIDVGAQVKKDTPITRTVSNNQVTSVRVTVGVDALMRTTKEGDQLKTEVSMSILLMKNNQIHSSKMMTLNEKGSKPFRLDFEFDDLPVAPFEIRCVRNTADSNDDMLRNNTYFFNYVESIDAKMRYPLSTVVGLEIDAEQFGNSSPSRTYGIKGAIVQVPSNYDPVNRTYSGLWDRLFKPAFTNNPVWVLYDILTNEVDGFGGRLSGFRIDIDKFYEASKYCDELVDDGAGGKEPRFVCNAAMMGEDAYNAINNVASSFRGVCAYNGELITLYYDRAHDVTAPYTNSNVVDGLFEYSQVESSKQYNQVQVQYVDENNGYETTVDEVSDDASIALLERVITLSIVAFGATKLSYARRAALWTLITSLTETELVTFKVGHVGIKHEIYDIIEIADNDYAGTTLGARVKSASGARITLDRALNDALKFSIETKAGPQNFNVKRQISEIEYELDRSPLIVENAPCSAILADVSPRLFRCLSIEENGDGTYTVSAIQHNPQKEAIVDRGAQYVPEGNTTIINPLPSISNGIASNDGRAIVLEWDSFAVIGTENKYRIQLFRDKALYKTFETKETYLRLENLPQGEYIAKIRAVNSNGQHSEEITIAFSTTYKIDGLRTKSIIFGIELHWQLPALITSDAFTEIWYSEQDDRMTATKLAAVVYPQNNYAMSGLSVTDQFYFWFRLVDAAGNQGDFTRSILGKPNDSADDILGYLDGKISEKEISKELQDQFDRNIDDAIADAKDEIQLEIEGIEIGLIDLDSEIENIKIDVIEIDSEIKNIKTDVIEIDSNINEVKKDAEKALSDAEKNAQDILNQSTVIDSVIEKQDQSEASWQLAQMSNVSAQKSNFARSMTMSAQVAKNIADIIEVNSLIVTERTSTATRFTQINTRVDNAESKITSVEEALSSDIKAEASKREALEAVFDLSKAQQQLHIMTQATADQSLSNRLFSMSASTANAHAKYDELQEVVATNESARVQSEQRLQAEINGNKANISRVEQVMTSEFVSQATSISNLSSELDDAKADIKQANQTIINNEKSQSQQNTDFNVQFDENNAKQQLAILTESSSSQSLSQRYFSLSAQTANSAAKIQSLEKTFADDKVAWALTEQRLQSQIDTSKGEISRVEQVVTTGLASQATSISNLSSELGGAKADIKQANQTIADNEKSQAKRNDEFHAQFDDNEAKQQLSLLTESSNTRSLSQRYFLLSAQTVNSAAKLESLEKVFASSETAWAITEQRLQAEINASKADISRIDRVMTTEFESQAASIRDLNAGLGSAKADIKIAEQAIIDNEKAQTASIRSLTSELESTKSAIIDINKTQSDDRESTTKQINAASSEWKSASEIKYLTGTVAPKTPKDYADLYGKTTVKEFGTGEKFSIGNRLFQTVTTRISFLTGVGNGRITQSAIENTDDEISILRERKSISDTEWSKWIELEDVNGSKAKADAAQKEAIRVSKASIDSLATTQANDKEALTEQINTANSEIGKNSASITQISTTQSALSGRVNALWTLKVSANGAVGGLMLGANEKESMFKVAADTFVVSTGNQNKNLFTIQRINGQDVAGLNVKDFIITGAVTGDKIAANTSIQAPVIKGGRVESGHFAGGSINIGNGNFNVDSNGDLVARSGRFEGTIYAEKIQGNIVNLIEFKRRNLSVFTEYIIPAQPIERYLFFLSLEVGDIKQSSTAGTYDGNLIFKINEQEVQMDFIKQDKYTNSDKGNTYVLNDKEFYTIPKNVEFRFSFESTRGYNTNYHSQIRKALMITAKAEEIR